MRSHAARPVSPSSVATTPLPRKWITGDPDLMRLPQYHCWIPEELGSRDDDEIDEDEAWRRATWKSRLGRDGG